MRSVFIGALAVLAVAAAAIPLVVVGSVHERSDAAAPAAPATAEIEAVVRNYLISNPEILVEVSAALETKRAADQQARQSVALADRRDTIQNSKLQVNLGNPEGEVTLVEFFDYNCGYCRHALPDMLKLMQEHPNLRVVLKEFPVLGPGSHEAAQVAIAVNQVAPERYLDFHTAMLTEEGPADREKAIAVARGLGLPIDAIEKAEADGTAAATIDEVYGIASALGINGTPSFVIGDQVIVGAVGFDALTAAVDGACGSASC